MIGGLYGRATAVRRAWYGRHPERRRRLDRPVVSVGNLVLGGSGKTPIVATLARLLADAGERPAILSRGYGRRRSADGVVVVREADRLLATVEESGDEPYMLARMLPGVPVLVSPDRHLAGRLAERRLDCTVHLLDDGFQHLRLERDVDLLVMMRSDLDERLLPFGSLREPLEAARAADALLVAGEESEVRDVATQVGVAQAFRVVRRYHPPSRPGRAVAVAGIARPERFFRALRDLGWDVAREITFRDHHWFTARDVAAIERAAAEAGAGTVITTEKDAARLETTVGRVPQAPDDERQRTRRPLWTVLPVEAVIEDSFSSWLAGRLAAARRRLHEARRGGEGGEGGEAAA